MLKQLRQRRREEGFTIIEVLIVLAIAGLIMVVVFLAVPNLQRSQRNNARKSDANNMLENLSEYVGNAGGALPGAACTGLSGCTWITYKPQQLTNVNYYATFATAPTTAPAKDTAYLVGGAVCGTTDVTVPISSTSARDYVIWYGVEGSTGHVCTQGS
jgi:prepilin-type N-terminal cleavage/methylation domain-containing protein